MKKILMSKRRADNPGVYLEAFENGGHMFRGKQDKAACDILKEFMRWE